MVICTFRILDSVGGKLEAMRVTQNAFASDFRKDTQNALASRDRVGPEANAFCVARTCFVADLSVGVGFDARASCLRKLHLLPTPQVEDESEGPHRNLHLLRVCSDWSTIRKLHLLQIMLY